MSSCNLIKNDEATQNDGFDRKNELFQLLEDLEIKVNNGTVLFVPPTACSNCLLKVAHAMDSLAHENKNVIVLYAKKNDEICINFSKLKKFSCFSYDESKIESDYGFYYWDPILFTVENSGLKSFKII